MTTNFIAEFYSCISISTALIKGQIVLGLEQSYVGVPLSSQYHIILFPYMNLSDYFQI